MLSTVDDLSKSLDAGDSPAQDEAVNITSALVGLSYEEFLRATAQTYEGQTPSSPYTASTFPNLYVGSFNTARLSTQIWWHK
jgi:hypothetical protein